MAEQRQIYSVSEINRKARMVLESAMGEVWVEGELSRVTIHSSGHWYFTLKDAGAAVSCAMFARDNAGVTFRPKDGMQVQLLARPSLYEASGRYQLIASKMEEAGKGNLQEQFEKLKAKLDAEGLFSEERKKVLPVLPAKIGVVTSPTGAAIRDIINVLTRRFLNIQVLLIPAKVQGGGAAQGIAKSIAYLNSRHDIDVMIVGRGGGSIEDLWAFNEEVVARAIAASEIPVISAVGHEIDFTIADFVADVRAPTPSAAAELAVREKGELEAELLLYQRRLNDGLVRMFRDFQLRLSRAAHSYVFREPEVLVKQYRQRILSLETRMGDLLKLESQAIFQRLERSAVRMEHLLESSVLQAHQRVDELSMVMRHEMQRRSERSRQKFQSLESQLRMLNPLAVLGRGYSLTRTPDGAVVRSAEDVKIGDVLVTQLADGKVVSNITEKG
ncbi:exodeoxyribonuclease VII large subunit [Verrucomicrobia bacterium S94]|nr:exodeoxyribonuclease VII large subunit [Verrucomicrobia bacterium S94]